MNFVRKPIGIVWKVYFMTNFSLSMIALYPFFRFYLAREDRFPKAFKLMRAWAHYLIYSNGLRFKIVQQNPLPEPPYIICANHTSYIDIVLTYCAFKDYFVFIGKQELSKAPLFNIFFKGMNVLVDRKSKMGSAKSMVKLANHIDMGHCIAIFPEGTISKNAPRLSSFKNGPFKLAIDKKTTLIPVTFINNWNLMQSGGFFKANAGPGKSTIIVGKAIETKHLNESEVDQLREDIYSILDGNLKRCYEL